MFPTLDVHIDETYFSVYAIFALLESRESPLSIFVNLFFLMKKAKI